MNPAVNCGRSPTGNILCFPLCPSLVVQVVNQPHKPIKSLLWSSCFKPVIPSDDGSRLELSYNHHHHHPCAMGQTGELLQPSSHGDKHQSRNKDEEEEKCIVEKKRFKLTNSGGCHSKHGVFGVWWGRAPETLRYGKDQGNRRESVLQSPAQMSAWLHTQLPSTHTSPPSHEGLVLQCHWSLTRRGAEDYPL